MWVLNRLVLLKVDLVWSLKLIRKIAKLVLIIVIHLVIGKVPWLIKGWEILVGLWLLVHLVLRGGDLAGRVLIHERHVCAWKIHLLRLTQILGHRLGAKLLEIINSWLILHSQHGL